MKKKDINSQMTELFNTLEAINYRIDSINSRLRLLEEAYRRGR